jgi:predicted amidohydrolase
MHRANLIAVAIIITFGFLAGCAVPVSERSVTAYEAARVIVGDGRVIENATLVVDGTKIAQVGRTTDVRVPSGARSVDLAGKTVMPMIIDTHVHLSPTRDALIRDLRRRAYYGVSAVLSMGLDGYEVLEVHNETIPSAARYLSAGRGITMPEPGRTKVPY